MGNIFTKSVAEVQEDLIPQTFDAVQAGKLNGLRELIERKPELLEARQNGKSLLHWAVIHSQLNCLQYLLRENIDPNIKDTKGMTPLMELATYKTNSTTTKMISLLVKSKADIDATNLHNRSVLMLSLIHFRYHVSDYLLDLGADPNKADIDGLRPIHICAKYMALPLLQKIIQKKADINAQDRDQRTPLYFAVFAGHQGIIDELLKHYADVNLSSLFGYPIQTAIVECRYSTVLSLLEHGACVNVPIVDQRSLFQKAKDCLNLALIMLHMHLRFIESHPSANIRASGEQPTRFKKSIKILDIIIQAYGEDVVLWKNPFFKNGQLANIFNGTNKESNYPDLQTKRKEIKILCRKLIFLHRLIDRGKKGLLPGEKDIKALEIPDSRSLQSLCIVRIRKLIMNSKTNVLYAVKQLDCTLVAKDMLLLKHV